MTTGITTTPKCAHAMVTMQALTAADANGEDCSQSMVLPRRPISDLTDSEWAEYISILKMAKDNDSGYFVFLEEPNGADADLTRLPKTLIKLYDLFVWQHHYVTKDNGRGK